MRRAAVAIAALVVVPALLVAPSAWAAPTAELSYDRGNGTTRAADLSGAVIQTFDGLDPYHSIGPGLLVGTHRLAKRWDVHGLDPETGEERFVIRDGFFPLVADGGNAVVFLPDGYARLGAQERDPTINSVWYFDVASGADHRLVKFQNSDRVPLHLAVSPDGDLVAVTHGNDADLFQFDIWVAATDHHEVRKLTDDDASFHPSVSPNGGRVAYVFRDGIVACPTEIRVIGVDGTGQQTVVAPPCPVALLRPAWVGPGRLVVWRWNAEGPVGLDELAVGTGALTKLVRAPVIDFSVSRTLDAIAFRLEGGVLRLLDLVTGDVTKLPGGKQSPGGRVYLSGALELAY